VISLGRTLLQDLYSSTPLASTFLPLQSVSDEPSGNLSATAGSRRSNILLQSPTADEIASYFSLVNPLKFSQPHQPSASPFSPPLNGLTLTAYNAGHSLGGTIWHLQHGMESIVYAVDWNQARENVFSGAAWFGGAASGAEIIEQLRDPTALVCSSKGGDKLTLAGGRLKRDELLLEMVRSSVAKGGTVLIPTDSSARVLELAYVLEHAWRQDQTSAGGGKKLTGVKLFLASKRAGATMRYARSMIEWMDDAVARDIEAEGRSNANKSHKRTDSKQTTTVNGDQKDGRNQETSKGPFDFKHLKIIERQSGLDRILANPGPQVILASDASMEWGFSKESLRRVAQKAENLVILTEHAAGRTNSSGSRSGIGQTLWEWYEERRDGVALEPSTDGSNLEQVHTGGRELEFQDIERSGLDTNDQLIYQQYLATQLHLKNAMQSRNVNPLDTTADAVEADDASSSSSDESDSEQQGRALNFSTTMAHSSRNKLGMTAEELGVDILTQRRGMHDYDVRGKRGRERMFPFVGKRKREDDFGDVIRPEEYLRAEEREEVDGDSNPLDPRKEAAPGQKRKWTEVGFSGNGFGRRMSQGASKRQQLRKGSASDDERPGHHANMNGQQEEDALDEGSDAEEETDAFQGPGKAVFKTSSVNINARLAFVDFSGLHDQRSLQMLIPLIHPRKLVLVGGTEDETASLATDCRNLAIVRGDTQSDESKLDVFTPSIGEVIDASVDTNAWVVKLSNSLLKHLTWQNVRGLGVVALTGQLGAEEIDEGFSEAMPKKQRLMKDEAGSENKRPQPKPNEDISPVLDVIPTTMAASSRPATQPLHVGDLRLADLRKLMQSSGHSAEFRGEGTLLIDGLVTVRKTGTGKVEVEGGGLSDRSRSRRFDGSFVSVKRKIYEGLAIVAGG
jgi:cleavage and polyadenylation specificity factor subunit 2